MIPNLFTFRVHREVVAGETVRIMLEVFDNDEPITLAPGDEFIRGFLSVDPWSYKPEDFLK